MAVLSVVLYHYPKQENQILFRALTHFGWVGVDLFFVLSGFLIGSQLFFEIARGGEIPFKTFYLRRFLRTLPSYSFILLIYLFMEPNFSAAWVERWRYFVFLQNLDGPNFFSHSWSLCIEEQFYLFFPVIFYFIFLRSVRIRLKTTIIVFSLFVLSGVFWRFMVWQKLRPDLIYLTDVSHAYETYLQYLFYPTYGRLDGLAVGVGLGAIKIFSPDLWNKMLAKANVYLLTSFFLIGVAFACIHWRMSFFSSVFGFPLLAFGFGAALIAVSRPDSWVSRLRIVGVQKISKISYSLYLSHPLAFGAANGLALGLGWASNTGLLALINLMTVTLFSLVLYHGVEQPFIKLRDRLMA